MDITNILNDFKSNSVESVEEAWSPSLKLVPQKWLQFLVRNNKEALIGEGSSLRHAGNATSISDVTKAARSLSKSGSGDAGCFITIEGVAKMMILFFPGKGFRIIRSEGHPEKLSIFPLLKDTYITTTDLQAAIMREASGENEKWTPKKGLTIGINMITIDEARIEKRAERATKVNVAIVQRVQAKKEIVDSKLHKIVDHDIVKLNMAISRYTNLDTSDVDDIADIEASFRNITKSLRSLTLEINETRPLSKDLNQEINSIK